MIKFFPILFALEILFSLVSAADYSENIYGSGCYGESCSTESSPSEETPPENQTSSSSEETSSRQSGSSARVVKNETPEQLLDVKFNIENTNLLESTNLISVVNLKNFGTTSFPVYLGYNIYDSSDNLVYNSSEEVQINTEWTSLKQFVDFSAPDGRYSLRLIVAYASVAEYFEQDFDVGEINFSPLEKKPSELIWAVISIFIILVLITQVLRKKILRGKKYQKPLP